MTELARVLLGVSPGTLGSKYVTLGVSVALSRPEVVEEDDVPRPFTVSASETKNGEEDLRTRSRGRTASSI